MSGQPVLVVAPHLIYPARNGSDISLDRIARKLSVVRSHVDLIASDRVVRFDQGASISEVRFKNDHRGKRWAAVRALASNGHFLGEKFLTKGFRSVLAKLDPADYGAVLYSYIVTASLRDVLGRDKPSLVWTHNNQFKWFRDLQQSDNPLTVRVARNTERWIDRFLRENADLTLLTVTDEDKAGYLAEIASLDVHVVPIGVDIPPGAIVRESSGPVRLLFAGALGVSMNLDALRHFGSVYFPEIVAAASDTTVTVAGSNPSPQLLAYCSSMGWDVRRDLSDEDMSELIAAATFTLLPFSYATGAKLKLLISLAHGTPVLATSVSAAAPAYRQPSLVSDDAGDWGDRIAEVRRTGVPLASRAALRESVLSFSWDRSAALLSDLIDSKNPMASPT